MKQISKNLIIIGAGSAGEYVSSEILNKNIFNYNIIGFLDKNNKKHGKTINGKLVFGNYNNLDEFIGKYNIDEIIIATTEINNLEVEKIYKIAKMDGVTVKILPRYEELLLKDPFNKQLREVSLEDLLGRTPLRVNDNCIREYIQNRKILITGAAGSIGSELCRQIVKYGPRKLVLLDMNENDLYLLGLFLKRNYSVDINMEICNIRERAKLDYLFNNYKPEIVFHAAAHKHVPLMEKNVDEAIKNNVFGTKNLVDLSDIHDVQQFVLISTDKAVNPTNVMGATKRLAEFLIENKNGTSKTKFMAVRFGNVLGSSGSVVPIFKDLIKEKKNLTVTHPEVTRYFMTIPEAVELVLEAGYLGEGGEVFVLDMGKPVKILQMAEKMIELSGLKIGTDIDIDIIGLRPGEKLYEELLYDVNCCEKTQNDKIFIAKIKNETLDLLDFEQKLMELKKILNTYDPNKMKQKLMELVPTYKEVNYGDE
ncbi:putative polysaccharide biosynthesis protein [Methanococcus maripaludis KA1]|uniref:Putative polysaccharide biosynthesis protein n=1 Tax=Methanococcus maripaludis KA1 TaxID=637914 RepID=A0A2Z5PDL7_METMI|nr:nucleoside-diphosphate sugar epimerase/dehydratase [Methanococcus maripaludis]BAP60490.1 putative polysaccharide biosynthesis protein [Methanococcus maripaludis KA1]